MKRLKYEGKIYHGYDGENSIKIKNGEIVEVSDDKAKQLLEDFPKEFSKVEEKVVEETQQKKRGRPSLK